MIYYRWRSGVAINLFTASEARFERAGGAALTVRQETGYPSSGGVTVRVDPAKPARFPLRLRIPSWGRGTAVQVNGQAVRPDVTPGSFFEIDREWKAGDTVKVDLPMSFRLVRGREQQAGRVAVMRGPLVFCLNPGQQKALATLDAADLGRYTLDPGSMAAVQDDAVHPGGIACRAGAWKPGYGTGPKHDVEVLLTGFPDPAGRATYFKLRDMTAAVDDELLRPARAR